MQNIHHMCYIQCLLLSTKREQAPVSILNERGRAFTME